MNIGCDLVIFNLIFSKTFAKNTNSVDVNVATALGEIITVCNISQGLWGKVHAQTIYHRQFLCIISH